MNSASPKSSSGRARHRGFLSIRHYPTDQVLAFSHKSAAVLAFIEETGATLMQLPLYSRLQSKRECLFQARALLRTATARTKDVL